MLIALDARTIYHPAPRGTGKNLLDLYRHLAQVRPAWRVIAYHRTAGEVPDVMPANVEPRRIEMIGDRYHAWQRIRLPMAAWRDGVDVLHCPANTSPQWMPVPTVVTIHDLIPLDMPQDRALGDLKRFENSIHHACRHAAQIICPSRYTRSRLVEQFRADPQRITVNPWAADSGVQPMARSAWAPVVQRYGVDRPYVLHFGAADIRKNTRRVIEAWAMVDAALRQNLQLLIVGLDESTMRALHEQATRLGVRHAVLLHGYAPQADVPALLCGAAVLAYPSLSEGFGLPILDAWTAGAAVLTSGGTATGELAADAAELVDPGDPCAIARGLMRLMRDHRYRADLVERGRYRAQRYTWAATAERFAQAVERAVGELRPLRAAA